MTDSLWILVEIVLVGLPAFVLGVFAGVWGCKKLKEGKSE